MHPPANPHPMPPYDVIVIGAGAAGIGAAVTAATAGARALVVEAFPYFGGASSISGGGCCIAGSPLQERLGIPDSPELAYRDWMAWGGEEADAEWARFYLERSRSDIYEWLEGLGVEWDWVQQHEGNSVARWHHPVGGGASLMDCLYAAARKLDIEWRFSTTVTRLLIADDRVAGVEVESDGRRTTLAAPAVLVATGGFAFNPEMLQRYIPDPGPGSRILLGGAPQALGKGHDLLEAVGAHFTQMDRVMIYVFGTPDPADPRHRVALGTGGVEADIWLNAQGQRFHNEQIRRGWGGTMAMMAQTPKTCWAVFDRAEADKLFLKDPRYRDYEPKRPEIERFLVTSPFAHQGDTFEELAAATGLPVAAAAAAIRRYNGFFAEGLTRDPDFGRDLTRAQPLTQPPFYAMQYFPMARKNLGGVRTDRSCRVLGADGKPIAGLYAAGEVAGMAGGHINGRAALEGTMLGPSLFSGRVAGEAVFADIAGRR